MLSQFDVIVSNEQNTKKMTKKHDFRMQKINIKVDHRMIPMRILDQYGQV